MIKSNFYHLLFDTSILGYFRTNIKKI